MSGRIVLLLSAVSLFYLLPPAAHACCPPTISICTSSTTWTTHIQSITPQVGIAGVTEVYVQGYCFGDSIGSITIGGVAVTKINSWSDYEIEFVVPYNAKTGDLVVTSQSYGSDDSLLESLCCGEGCNVGENWPGGGDTHWCGNDVISGDFTVANPQNPPFILTSGETSAGQACSTSQPCRLISGTPSTPQYIDGSWYFTDGGLVEIFNITQATQDRKTGMWTLTGTSANNIFGGPFLIQAGEMDTNGDVMVETDQTGNGDDYDCWEFQILSSGDVTSPVWMLSGLGAQSACPTPRSNFLASLYTEADEGPYWDLIVPPLFKTQNSTAPFVSQTDVPALETPSFVEWVNVGITMLPTFADWLKTDAGSPDMNGMFESRFIYEQSGGTAVDNCYISTDPNSPAEVTSTVSGGGWFLSGDQWADTVGDYSEDDTYYQNHLGPNRESCTITGPQAMYIDSRLGPVTSPFEPYTTNTLMPVDITPTELFVGVQPEGEPMVKECQYYPSGNGKCR